MSFPRYERYKDSGVDWLGEVPEHWDNQPLYRIGREREESNHGLISENLLSLSYGRIIRKDIKTSDGLLPESFETYQIIHPGDIVFRLTDLQNDKRSLRTAIVTESGIITFAYVAFEPTGILPAYLNYLLRDYDLRKIFYSMGGGVRQSMNFDDIKRLPALVPPKSEQSSIVKLLDYEIAKVDALINEQRRLIDLLKEKRQAAISHAVTKGLDPDVQMKDSGVEWVGQVPCSWQLKRLRMIATVRGGVAKGRDLGESETITVPYLRVANVQDGYLDLNEVATLEITAAELDRYRLCPGDVLMNEGGDFDKLGRGHIWRGEIENCIHQNHVFSVRPRDIEPEWLTLISTAECGRFYFMTRSKQSTNLASISSSNLGELPVPLPPPSERKEILERVDALTKALNALVQDAVSAITLLEERRSALISAAVTGRIDVRSSLRKPVASAKPYTSGFAHQLLAAEILTRCNDSHMGRTKLQKLIHLTEHHAQISELVGQYTRKMAGPLDMKAMIGVEKGLAAQSWYKTVKSDGRYRYEPLTKQGQHAKYLEPWERLMPRIAEVLNLLGSATMRQCEIVSTLYAAWNDLLIEDAAVSDTSILHEASSAERWHKSKEQIAPERWSKALQWMKDKGLVPVGYGKHTRNNPDTINATAEVANEPA